MEKKTPKKKKKVSKTPTGVGLPTVHYIISLCYVVNHQIDVPKKRTEKKYNKKFEKLKKLSGYPLYYMLILYSKISKPTKKIKS